MCTSYANIHKGKNDILKFAKKHLVKMQATVENLSTAAVNEKNFASNFCLFLEESWQNTFNLKALVHNP